VSAHPLVDQEGQGVEALFVAHPKLPAAIPEVELDRIDWRGEGGL
jgi:hypothetical protein